MTLRKTIRILLRPVIPIGAEPMEIALDTEFLTGLGVTSLHSDDLFTSLNSDEFFTAPNTDPIDTDSHCSSQMEKRKRNGASCPVPGMPTSLEIFVDDHDSEIDPEILSTPGDKKNPECEEKYLALVEFLMCAVMDHSVHLPLTIELV